MAKAAFTIKQAEQLKARYENGERDIIPFVSKSKIIILDEGIFKKGK